MIFSSWRLISSKILQIKSWLSCCIKFVSSRGYCFLRLFHFGLKGTSIGQMLHSYTSWSCCCIWVTYGRPMERMTRAEQKRDKKKEQASRLLHPAGKDWCNMRERVRQPESEKPSAGWTRGQTKQMALRQTQQFLTETQQGVCTGVLHRAKMSPMGF